LGKKSWKNKRYKKKKKKESGRLWEKILERLIQKRKGKVLRKGGIPRKKGYKKFEKYGARIVQRPINAKKAKRNGRGRTGK